MTDMTDLLEFDLTEEESKEMKEVMKKIHPYDRIQKLCMKGIHMPREHSQGHPVCCDVCDEKRNRISQCFGCDMLICLECWSGLVETETAEDRAEKADIIKCRIDAIKVAGEMLCRSENEKKAVLELTEKMTEDEAEYQSELDEHHMRVVDASMSNITID